MYNENPLEAIKSAYWSFKYEAKRDFELSCELLDAYNRIEYKTKSNGTPYKAIQDNFVLREYGNNSPVVYRKARAGRKMTEWIEVCSTFECFKTGYAVTFELDGETLDGIKARINTKKEELKKKIEKLEKYANCSFDEFINFKEV